MKMRDNKRLGGIGEKVAIEYLKKQGYHIIETNFKCKQGEIDIIAADDDIIVFIEVKTRSSDVYGQPSEAVNYYKQRKIVQVALTYLAKRNLFNWMSRFDVVEVIMEQTDKIANINLIKNAFEYSGKYGY
ncbi:MAG: YraN family protein [Clostridiales bacterium]|nr:YraN family protein [Clostridiales bacterium]